MMAGFGVPGVVLFVLGLPLALLFVLVKNHRTAANGHRKLDDPEVRCKLL